MLNNLLIFALCVFSVCVKAQVNNNLATTELNRNHLEKLADTTISSKQASFLFLLSNYKEMDSLFNSPGYTSGRIEDIIYKEEILPRLWKCDGDCKPITNKPNWNNFQKILFLKYPKAPIAKILQTSKIKWYEYLKDTIALIRENVSKIETFGLDTVGFAKPELNNMVYNLVFKGSNDPIVLKKAISWMEVLVKIEPNAYYFIDTYANLLYKAGRVKEALDWETKATNIAPDNEEIAENLLKMKGRKQTWPGGK